MKFLAHSSIIAVLTMSSTQVAAQGRPPPPPPQPTFIFTDTTLVAPSANPFFIAADDITLDCAGNSISLPGPPSFIPGITLDNRKGITIKNCNISNWFFGIRLEAFSSVTLENVAISNSVVNGLDANDGSRILLKGTFSSTDNGVFGINLNQDVSLTMRGAEATLTGNTAGAQIALRSSLVMDAVNQNLPSSLFTGSNDFFGITVTSNSHLFLFGDATVEARNNGSNGITIFTKSAVEVDRQGTLICEGNTLDGIRAEDSSINLFSINLATRPTLVSKNNGEAGIRLAKKSIFDTNSAANTFITDNINGGILVDNNSIVTLKSATVKNNGYANVYLSFGSNGDFEGNNIDGDIKCDSVLDNEIRGDEGNWCRPL